MSLPILEQILQATAARLALVPVAGLKTERNRRDEVTAFPMLILHDGDQVVDDEQLMFDHYFRTVLVEGFVREQVDADLGPSLNELYAQTVKTLGADVSLGGLAIDIREGELLSNMNPMGDVAHQGQFQLKFTIEFATAKGDPFTVF